jgi:hypothetical protein
MLNYQRVTEKFQILVDLNSSFYSTIWSPDFWMLRQVRRIDTAKDIAENLAKSPNVMCAEGPGVRGKSEENLGNRGKMVGRWPENEGKLENEDEMMMMDSP